MTILNHIKETFINLFLRHQHTLLGRWQLTSCSKMLDRKIDLSNEDHCGPCGQMYSVTKNKNKERKSYLLPKITKK